MFHSARWDHDHDLEGERVAVIGTGRLGDPVRARDPAATSAQLTLFQRTPPWVMPAPDRPIRRARAARSSSALPLAQRLCRGAIYACRESRVVPFTQGPA